MSGGGLNKPPSQVGLTELELGTTLASACLFLSHLKKIIHKQSPLSFGVKFGKCKQKYRKFQTCVQGSCGLFHLVLILQPIQVQQEILKVRSFFNTMMEGKQVHNFKFQQHNLQKIASYGQLLEDLTPYDHLGPLQVP